MKMRCPDEEILGSYIQGCLSSEERLDVEAHLSDCEVCLENFMLGKHLAIEGSPFETEPAPAWITRSAINLVNDLNLSWYDRIREKAGILAKETYTKVSEYLEPMIWEEQPAMVRGNKPGAENTVQVKKRFGETDIAIEIEKTETQTAHIRIQADQARSSSHLRVTLKKGEREVASLNLEREGILFEDIPAGNYSLVFFQNSSEIGTYQIKEISHGK